MAADIVTKRGLAQERPRETTAPVPSARQCMIHGAGNASTSGQTTAKVEEATMKAASAEGDYSDQCRSTAGRKRYRRHCARLKAVLIAFGRSRSNHGATMALSAAMFIAGHRAPLNSSDGTSCHGLLRVRPGNERQRRQAATPAQVSAAHAEAAIGLGQGR